MLYYPIEVNTPPTVPLAAAAWILPSDPTQILMACLSLAGGVRNGTTEDLVLLRDKSLSMMVKVGEIASIEAHGDYTRILLNEGENLMMKQTLSLWESQLPTALFAKVSRRLLVNTQSVAKMVRKNLLTWELHLQGTKEPIQLSNLESKRLRALL